MAGIPLGEAAEKKAEEQRLKEMKDQEMQARAALKAEEENKDKQAYDTKASWLPALSGQPLASKLDLPDEPLFQDFTNATENLRIGAMIEQDTHENLLRAIRHKIRQFQDERSLNQKQKNELGFLVSNIKLRLGNLVTKGVATNAQGGNFAALPEDKEAYDRFQYVWSEAQKNPSGKLYKDLNRTRGTDELIKIITSAESSLPDITFNKQKQQTISFSKATALELKAFKYALSQMRTSSFNPAAVKELTQTIHENIRDRETQMTPMLKERAWEEERIAKLKFGQAKPIVAPQSTSASQQVVPKAPPVVKKTPLFARKQPAAAPQQAIDPQLAKIVEKLQEQGVPAMRAYKVAGQLLKMGKAYGERPVPQQDIDEANTAIAAAAPQR